jgi:hypothetical protein
MRNRWTAAEDRSAQNGSLQRREQASGCASIGEWPALTQFSDNAHNPVLGSTGQAQQRHRIGNRNTGAFQRRQLRMNLRTQRVGQGCGHWQRLPGGNIRYHFQRSAPMRLTRSLLILALTVMSTCRSRAHGAG